MNDAFLSTNRSDFIRCSLRAGRQGVPKPQAALSSLSRPIYVRYMFGIYSVFFRLSTEHIVDKSRVYSGLCTRVLFLPPIILCAANGLNHTVHSLALRYGNLLIGWAILIGPGGNNQEAVGCA